MTHAPSPQSWLTPGEPCFDWSSAEAPVVPQANPHWRSEVVGDYVALGAVIFQSLKRAASPSSVAGALTIADLALDDELLDCLTAGELRDVLSGFTNAVRADLGRERP